MKFVFRKKRNLFFATLLDWLGYPIIGYFRRKKKPATMEAKNILLVRLDHLGDALAVSDASRLLKKKFPMARIAFLVSSMGAAVLQNNPYVDELIVYDAPWFLRKKAVKKKGIGFWDLSKLIREKEFDLALAPRGDLRENFLLWKAGIPRRIGFGITGGGFFLSEEIFYRFGVHESQHTMDILRTLGIREGCLEKKVYFSEDEEKQFSDMMCAQGVSPAEQWVGFQLDAGTESKNWPEENSRLFLKKFSVKFPNQKMLFVGSDIAKSDRLMEFVRAEKIASNYLSLVGKTSARELFYVLRTLRVFVGHDSGPTHVAASMGVPTLFLYSGTNVFEEWKPLSAAASVLRHPVPCAPCYRTDCNVSGHPCMADIQPESVLDWLEQKIGKP